jgi:hypothetical protein
MPSFSWCLKLITTRLARFWSYLLALRITEGTWGGSPAPVQFRKHLALQLVVLRDSQHLTESGQDYDRTIQIYSALVEVEGRKELVGNLENALFNRALAYGSMKDWTRARADIDRGGELLRQAIAQGRQDLLASFLQTVARRCGMLDELGGPELVACWVNDAARWLLQAVAAQAVTPVLQEKARPLLAAVAMHIEQLSKAGLDVASVNRAVQAIQGQSV